MFSFVTFIIMKYQRNLGYKKSCFKHFADVDTSDVYLKSGERNGGVEGWGKYPVGICHSHIKEVRKAFS